MLLFELIRILVKSTYQIFIFLIFQLKQVYYSNRTQMQCLFTGPRVHSVPCLPTGASLTSDPGAGVRSWPSPILSWRLIMKYFLRSFSSLPLNHSRRVVVSYKRKYVHEILVNRLFKLAQEKVFGELTVRP